jgi:hypothetical protein
MIRLSLVLMMTAWGTTVAAAQWLNYPASGIPRLPDGKPNLSAPAPRDADGKPDLSGIWFIDQTPEGAFGERPLALRSEVNPEDIVLTPEGETLQRQRMRNTFAVAQCSPVGIPGLAAAQPFKIISSKSVIVILYELETTFRQIFMDGRPLPTDPNPAFRGYSVGKWDGDTLVVDTTGFNDRGGLLGRAHSEALHIIERFRRRDLGHLEIEYTIVDPRIYAKPFTVRQRQHLTPDSELLEYICNENEKDLKHMVGVSQQR